jgi:hypothetical protein
MGQMIADAAERYSPFGEVPGRGTPFDWLGSYEESRSWLAEHWPLVRSTVIADTERLRSTGWQVNGHVMAPELFTPGDGPALRAASLGLNPDSVKFFDAALSPSAASKMDDFTLRVLSATIARAERLVTSEFAYLPAATSVTLLGAFRPDRDLFMSARLPYRRMFVFFGAPMRFTHASTWWDPEHVAALDRIDIALGVSNGLPEDVALSQLPSKLYRNGGAVAAVWLESDESGKLLEDVGFVGFINHEEKLRDPRLIIGNLRRSTLTPLLENLVCALCWGHWVIQGEQPQLPDPTTREFRRMLNTSKFRRLSRSGSVDGVRMLDLRTETTRSKPGPDASTGRTVAAHLRRGHFRRVRVVRRDAEGRRSGSRSGLQGTDWEYEGRWIPPTVVNPQIELLDEKRRVYMLPEPPSPEEYAALQLLSRASEGENITEILRDEEDL